MQDKNAQNKITELVKKIKELEDRLRAHSIPVITIKKPEDLEKIQEFWL